ncbi:LOW QUALITY PROTEIN: coiled-coil domain-containing protein 62-like [Acropora millepora]|uniref:LOW QUALITY PROTEIN: coiled-coil domain-containing protein 62-like n=1 Tax=Acropora millepora TaxID=45264 RepID=UPI001CF45DAA|nr:LOW QUALITY PROTEIN: coiled-coil domain-containing protein 62-like [Acropora millepora]
MERFAGSLPVKGYSGEFSGKKRVQLPSEREKGYSSSSNLYHSTPKTKPVVSPFVSTSPSYKSRANNTSYQAGVSPVRNSRSKSPLHSTSPVRQAVSPRLHNSSLSPTSKQLADVDSDTIQRQRRELQLLIGELKDRDRELNDMVQAHQKQIVAWEEDRQRVFSLEKRSARIESELKNRNDQLKSLQSRLKASETEEKNKVKELENTQLQLQQVSEHANTSFHQVQELEEKNSALTSSMRELSNTIGQLQAREQELVTKLRLKDNDIMEANVSLGELQQKIKRLEGLCQELRKTESTLRTERDQWRDQATGNKHEVEKLRGDISKQFSDADEAQAELGKTKQEVLVLQKEIFLSGEREKRKDQLLDLQKSKQERTDSELQNLRQICERQQRDISYMQLQLQSSHDMLSKHITEPDGISELESNPPDDEKKPISSIFDPSSYHLNGDYFENQDQLSTKSLDFDAPVSKGVDDDLSAYIPGGGGISSLSMHATAGSDLADDLENISQDPLQPIVMSEKGFPGSGVETLPPSRNPAFFSTPNTRTDTYPPLGNLSVTNARHEDHSSLSSFSAGRPVDLSTSGTPSRPADSYLSYSVGMAVTMSSPPKAEGDSSPTSKLHRLLAESRQMVQNLEQSTTLSFTGSPKQDSSIPTSEQYTPPQRHLGSPLHSRPMPTSTE